MVHHHYNCLLLSGNPCPCRFVLPNGRPVSPVSEGSQPLRSHATGQLDSPRAAGCGACRLQGAVAWHGTAMALPSTHRTCNVHMDDVNICALWPGGETCCDEEMRGSLHPFLGPISAGEISHGSPSFGPTSFGDSVMEKCCKIELPTHSQLMIQHASQLPQNTNTLEVMAPHEQTLGC